MLDGAMATVMLLLLGLVVTLIGAGSRDLG